MSYEPEIFVFTVAPGTYLGIKKMKKIILFCAAFFVMLLSAVNADAQQRTKIGEGIYLTTYGDVSVIENDNVQMTMQLKVEKAGTNSVGENVYNILCGNKWVKGLLKAGLTKGIQTALASSGIPLPKWAVGPIVSGIYDSVCEYFGEK